MLSLATFMPPVAKFSSSSKELQAGPIVQTSLVFRNPANPFTVNSPSETTSNPELPCKALLFELPTPTSTAARTLKSNLSFPFHLPLLKRNPRRMTRPPKTRFLNSSGAFPATLTTLRSLADATIDFKIIFVRS
ncbi:hypothetical protein V8G54_030291 [Vigna mungo]|uniref:Uncharacterized protein n=1 Tax=Vigna mungo TaxID=3915 RepID=A0AAQ3RNI1_VIGMU